MANDIQKFKIQYEYYLNKMHNCLFGTGEEQPGICHFHAQMVDIYARLRLRAKSRMKDICGVSKFHDYLRENSFTREDYCKIFLLKEVVYDLAPNAIANGYNRLVDASKKLNDKKNKIVFSGWGFNNILNDLMLDYNAFCVFNNEFRHLNDSVNKLKGLSANYLTEMLRNNTKVLTDKDIADIKKMDKKHRQLIEEYNNKILDDKKGIKQLFYSADRLMRERLAYYNVLDKAYSTKFDEKYRVMDTEIPMKEVAQPIL